MQAGGGISVALTLATALAAVACLATSPAAYNTPASCASPPASRPAAARDSARPARAASPTRLAMRGVRLRFDTCVAADVWTLDGRMTTTRDDGVVVLDDPRSFAIDVDDAQVSLSAPDLERLFNGRVFNYRGAPLQALRITLDSQHVVIAGRVRLDRWVAFSLTARPERNPDGRLRMRHRTLRVLGWAVPRPVRSAIGLSLQKALDLRGASGVRAEGDDLLLDVGAIFPPPAIRARVADASLAGTGASRRLVIRLGPLEPVAAATARPTATPPARYLAFIGGRVRFGRLLMEPADLTIVPADSGALFDFSLLSFHRQLVAGTSQTRADSSLLVRMPDFGSLPPAP